MPKTLIIIPTYNEIENLPLMIPALEGLGLDLDVLIVDDGSPDDTGAWVKEQQKSKPHLHLIERKGKLGLGSAYVRGFRYALEHDYEFVFEMDADFSHDPHYVKDFLAAIHEADLVIGSRYINGVNVVNWPMSRLLLSYFANMYARWITGMPVRDATGGFKCFRADALRKLNLDGISSGGYSFQIEVNYKLWKKGCRIREIPIIFKDRTAGTSKMSGGIIREALFLLLKLRLGGGR
jgi:dolichol-phosphate mannosyltransferase